MNRRQIADARYAAKILSRFGKMQECAVTALGCTVEDLRNARALGLVVSSGSRMGASTIRYWQAA